MFLIDLPFLFDKYIRGIPNPEPQCIKVARTIRGPLFVDVGLGRGNANYYSRFLQKNFEKIITIDSDPLTNPDICMELSDKQGHTWDDLHLDATFLKLDVEGMEFQVLEGMNKFLPEHLLVELHDYNRQHELIGCLGNKGYKVKPINIRYYHGIQNAKSDKDGRV